MFNHYLKIAWRNLLKNKVQSLISILGLTIGVMFFAYGYHWYKFETTYDDFYPYSDRIYRLYGIHKGTGKLYADGFVPYISVDKLKSEFPEIEETAVQFGNYGSSYRYNGENIGYPTILFMDDNFLKMFPQKVIAGTIDLEQISSDNEIYVTKSFANRIFNSPEEALDETIVSAYGSYHIKAVVEDPPPNTRFTNEVFIKGNFAIAFNDQTDEAIQWRDLREAKLFIRLHPNTDIEKFATKLRTYAIDNGYNENLLFEITPLSQVRFVVPDRSEKIIFGVGYICTFIMAGMLLILAAFLNYLNILIKNVIVRVREINLRRVSGASVKEIFSQLLIEMMMQVGLVTLLSLFLIEVTTSVFERTFDTIITQPNIYFILLIAIGVLIVSLSLSAYLFLHRFIQRSSYIKHFSGRKELNYSRASLAFQLAISVFFIMSAVVFYSQVRFMKHADWGIETDDILQIEMRLDKRSEFMEHISKLPVVEQIAESDYFSIYESSDNMEATNITDVTWDEKNLNFNPQFQTYGVGDNFFDVFGIELLEGRNFIAEDFTHYKYETDKIIINQAAVKTLSIDNPIGKKITIPLNSFSTGSGRWKKEYEIIGIVQDFHTVGMRSKIPPVLIKGFKADYRGFRNYVKTVSGMEQEAIKAINEIIPNYEPDSEDRQLVKTMNSIFLELSVKEQNLLKLFLTVSLLCILIAVFGIYSVSQRETQRRRKEIAIRKTSGAKTKEIMQLFFREYLTITLFASAIALPFAWLFMYRWLQSFAYHISIAWWMFAVVILLVAAIVIITIFSQVFKASNQNPAEVVKAE